MLQALALCTQIISAWICSSALILGEYPIGQGLIPEVSSSSGSDSLEEEDDEDKDDEELLDKLDRKSVV